MSPKASDEVRSRDTSPDAQAFLDRLFREKSEGWRAQRFFAVNHFARGGGNVDEGTRFTRALLAMLRDNDVPFMVVGSTASSWLGDARTTQDIDAVVDPRCADALVGVVRAAVAATWYADESAARDAFLRRGMVNMIDPDTGWKADLILKADADYDRVAFDRRVEHDSPVGPCPIPTVEDQLLSKLRWAQFGGSERQLRDCAGLLRHWHATLDRAYLDAWADRIGVRDDLQRLLGEHQS